MRTTWESGCRDNQEAAEHLPLYLDPVVKTGPAVRLARQIREGLDRTDSER